MSRVPRGWVRVADDMRAYLSPDWRWLVGRPDGYSYWYAVRTDGDPADSARAFSTMTDACTFVARSTLRLVES